MSGLLPLRLLSQPEVPQSRRSSRLSRSASFRRQSTVYSSTATSDRTLTKQRIAVPIMTQANRPREKRDWKLVMNVARDLYIAEQYQDCYTYCISVLELTRGLSHPLHTIYLSFYAGIASELSTKQEPCSSSHKMELFNQACAYYRKALFYVPTASYTRKSPFQDVDFENVMQRYHTSLSMYDRALNSDGSSRSSTNDSVFSAININRDRTSSPTSSINSEVVTDGLSNLRIRKRGQFQPKLPILVSEPDLKAYLGEDAKASSTTKDNNTHDTLISARASVQNRIATLNKSSANCAALLTQVHPRRSTSLRNPVSPIVQSKAASRESMSVFMRERSIARYEDQLFALEKQIKRHLADLEDVIPELSRDITATKERVEAQGANIKHTLLSPISLDPARADSKMSYHSYIGQEQNIKMTPAGNRSANHLNSTTETNPFRRHIDNLYDNIVASRRGSNFDDSGDSSNNFLDESSGYGAELEDDDDEGEGRRMFDSIETVLESSWMDESWMSSLPLKSEVTRRGSIVRQESQKSQGNQDVMRQHDLSNEALAQSVVFAKSYSSRCTSPEGTFGAAVCPLRMESVKRNVQHQNGNNVATLSESSKEVGRGLPNSTFDDGHVEGDSWF